MSWRRLIINLLIVNFITKISKICYYFVHTIYTYIHFFSSDFKNYFLFFFFFFYLPQPLLRQPLFEIIHQTKLRKRAYKVDPLSQLLQLDQQQEFSLRSIFSQNPFLATGLNTPSLNFNGTMVLLPTLKLHLARMLNSSIFISVNANLLPMHFLGPIPNGMYAPELAMPFPSLRNLSGSNLSGFSKYFGSWWIALTGNQMFIPLSSLKGRAPGRAGGNSNVSPHTLSTNNRIG